MKPYPHIGFYKHGNLPHFDEAGACQFVTLVLADAAPTRQKSRTIRLKRNYGEEEFLLIDNQLDRGLGACLLENPAYASEVVDVACHSDDLGMDLIAWVVMPNHAHLLLRQHEGCQLGEMICKLKSRSARRINLHRGASGKFWQIGYFDRFMRNEAQLRNTIDYIHNNPVEAGLAASPADWRFSSFSQFDNSQVEEVIRRTK